MSLPCIGIVTPDVDDTDLPYFRAAARRAGVTLDVVGVADPALADRARRWDAAMAYVLDARHAHAWTAVGPHLPMSPTLEQSRSADKWHCHLTLTAAGVPSPDTVRIDDTDGLSRLGWPVVTKVSDASGGVGIRLAHTAAEVAEHAAAGATLAQQFLTQATGRDLRIVIVGGQVLSRVHRIASDPGEFRSNIRLGGQAVPAEPDAEPERLAVAATAACDLHVAGVDLLRADERWWVCEVNAAPGFTGAPASAMADAWLAPHARQAHAHRASRSAA